MKKLLLLVFGVNLALVGRMPAQTPVVVQLFDWTFAEISTVLPELEELGYTHIHVSPVQKSVENGKWWGKYQPLDFRKIEGPLGNRDELITLAREAKKHGLSLMVDVVLNHMAATPHVRVRRGRLKEVFFADFSKEDFHPFAPINDWSDERQVRNRWLFGALPDLKTESPAVRAKLRAHLLDLRSCGVDSFRVDSARHIPPGDLAAIFSGVDGLDLVVGEIAEKSLPVFAPYLAELPEMGFFDFPFQARLAACLRGERPLSSLAQGNQLRDALPARRSVRLLRNHDLDRGEARKSEGINDPHHRLPAGAWQIGYCALFGMGRGIPYVFVDHPQVVKAAGEEHRFDREGLKEAILFFRKTSTEEAQVFWSTSESLAWTFGKEAFVILNRKASSEPVSLPMPQLRRGVYRDAFSGSEVDVGQGVLTVPPLDELRGYSFQLKQSD